MGRFITSSSIFLRISESWLTNFLSRVKACGKKSKLNITEFLGSILGCCFSYLKMTKSQFSVSHVTLERKSYKVNSFLEKRSASCFDNSCPLKNKLGRSPKKCLISLDVLIIPLKTVVMSNIFTFHCYSTLRTT